MAWNSIFAIGRNYAAHAAELGNEVPNSPVIFSKTGASLTRNTQLNMPASLGEIHFELELVYEIGQPIPLMAPHLGPDVFSGMGLGIDFTARDIQSQLKTKGLSWELAKSFQDSCFVGPMVAPVGLNNLRFQLLRGDTILQNGDPNLMLFSPLDLLRYINRTSALEQGDLLFTGTPVGVGPTLPGDCLRLKCEALQTDITVRINRV